ncbi:MAG TPA: class I SAM-dependent methyltransferase [Mycobacteriales bacterium]|jgi:cyclopropane fatty-acyl-phospholipid synthase-like methyltransferase|nr:class I SAM-dependent methyltransferase [Mycobacteriales bacterium]
MTDNSSERWDAAYADDEDPAPWVIEQPQPEVIELINRQLITGRLLDSGCGTGEHSLLAAEHGAVVTGVDISRNAIEVARRKAAARVIAVDFAVVNMLEVVPFDDGAFDTVLDSGVFHSFAGAEQRAYVENLTRLTTPTGLLHLICFSEHQPGEGEWGPRRITQEEIRTAFVDGWLLEEIEPAIYHINEFRDTTHVKAWRALLRRRP